MKHVEVIFIEPQFEGNIGSLCRAMKNFGFSDLILVNPPEIGDDTYRLAKHAKDILESRVIKKSFEESLMDLDYVIGTTGVDTISDKKFLRRTFTPTEASEKVKDIKGNIGIVFGRENYGLYNEELSQCDMLIKIPTTDDYPIMNVSHAAAIILYEFSSLEWNEEREVATKKEMMRLHEYVHDILTNVGYPKHKQKKTETMLARALSRAVVTKYEYSMLMGIIAKIRRKIRK